MAEHKIVHWELMGPDGDKLASFYENLFGWKSEAVAGFDGYNMVSGEQTGVGGAIGAGSAEMPAFQTIYVEVDNVDEHLAKAQTNGGKTVVPRTIIPGMVTFGQFTDPAGNLIGLVEAETPSAE